jgi:predicted TIM-barrel fold metal-dependent hydrolase
VNLAKAEPKLKLVVLNCYPQMKPDQLSSLAPIGNVYFELSMVERVGAVARLIETVTLDRVLFGSHSPFFYFESAELKVQEAGLSEAQKRAVLEGNARRLIS